MIKDKKIDKKKTIENLLLKCGPGKINIEKFNNRMSKAGAIEFLVEACELNKSEIVYID